MSLLSDECCKMDRQDLFESEHICADCRTEIEDEGEDLTLDLARDNYNYMRYGDE